MATGWSATAQMNVSYCNLSIFVEKVVRSRGTMLPPLNVASNPYHFAAVCFADADRLGLGQHVATNLPQDGGLDGMAISSTYQEHEERHDTTER